MVYERPSPPPGAGEKPAETVLSDLGLAGTVARLARERQARQAAAAANSDAEVQQVMEARQAGTAGTAGTAAVEGAAEAAAEELPAPAPAVPATGTCSSSSSSSSRHFHSKFELPAALPTSSRHSLTPKHKAVQPAPPAGFLDLPSLMSTSPLPCFPVRSNSSPHPS